MNINKEIELAKAIIYSLDDESKEDLKLGASILLNLQRDLKEMNLVKLIDIIKTMGYEFVYINTFKSLYELREINQINPYY